jgi:hypothetical protein
LKLAIGKAHPALVESKVTKSFGSLVVSKNQVNTSQAGKKKSQNLVPMQGGENISKRF